MNSIGKFLILAGAALMIFGVIFLFGQKLPWLGKLPGDIYVQKKNFTFFFPITTSILISIALSLVLYLLRKR